MNRHTRAFLMFAVLSLVATVRAADAASASTSGPDAQPAAPAPIPPDGSGESLRAQLERDLSDAKAAARNKDAKAAEKALLRGNRAKPNTPEWDAEAGHKLIETARQLTEEGFAEDGAPLSALAIERFEKVAKSGKDKQVKAHAKAMVGRIHERHTGDLASAIASYEAAAALDPDDLAIGEALTRLKETDAMLRERLKLSAENK